ncbi:MAG: DNA-directed RNA polymerase subunit omega [Bdellovibrionales bacterium]|nr:DNA-directed RNA polymerase subunit omega [Bdellovibrionales bacterium]
MARITVEDCLDKVPNRFALVLLVAKRAKQFLKGANSTYAVKDENKNIVNALREVASGTVYFDTEDVYGSPDQQVEKDLAGSE